MQSELYLDLFEKLSSFFPYLWISRLLFFILFLLHIFLVVYFILFRILLFVLQAFLHMLLFRFCPPSYYLSIPFLICMWPATLMLQVEFESALEHPFFVFDQGWSSCYPERTLQCYGLKCHRLQVGDVCISLTPRTKSTKRAENPRKRRWSAPDQFCNDDDAPPASASMKRKKDWASQRYLKAVFLCDVQRHCAGDPSVSRPALRLASSAIHWWAASFHVKLWNYTPVYCSDSRSAGSAIHWLVTPSFVVTKWLTGESIFRSTGSVTHGWVALLFV